MQGTHASALSTACTCFLRPCTFDSLLNLCHQINIILQYFEAFFEYFGKIEVHDLGSNHLHTDPNKVYDN